MLDAEYVPSELLSVTYNAPLSLDEKIIFDMASALEDEAISVSWVKGKENWEIQWVFEPPAPLSYLTNIINQFVLEKITEDNLQCSPIKTDINWLEHSYQQFPPFEVGRFFIFGSHYDGEKPADKIPLQIDAATAFGSGEHGTTKGCLEALLYLHENKLSPQTILDMGAGSGILGIAAHKLWQKPVLAVDIDDEATRMALHHSTLNNVPTNNSGMVCVTGDGYKTPDVTACKNGFDLIIANILAGPLIAMAGDLYKTTAVNGTIILSGLLQEQEDDVLKAHEAEGFAILHKIPHGEWQTLVMRKG